MLIVALTDAGSLTAFGQSASSEEDASIAQSLAEMLRDARAIISNNQNRINDPDVGDKGLTGEVVLDQAVQIYKQHTGVDPRGLDAASRQGRLLLAMMGAMSEVMDANQGNINAKGIGFKAFIPAVFGRLVGESFARLTKGEAELKITAPHKHSWIPDWASEGEVGTTRVPFRTADAEAQIVAMRGDISSLRFSRIANSEFRRARGPDLTAIPCSIRKARIWLIVAVRRETNRARTR